MIIFIILSYDGLADLYRITSYTGPAVADTNPAFGMQLHHPRFFGVYRGTRVSSAVVPFPDVLGPTFGGGGCFGGCG